MVFLNIILIIVAIYCLFKSVVTLYFLSTSRSINYRWEGVIINDASIKQLMRAHLQTYGLLLLSISVICGLVISVINR